MPDRSSVEFKGGDDAIRDMQKWADELGPEVVKESRDLAESIASAVQGTVPVLTGNFSSSVSITDEELGWGVSIGDGVEYAGWLEFGGSRGRELVPEGRYLYPTAQEYEQEYASRAADIASDSVGRFAWSTPSA